jgi:hypothetical protein
MGIEGETPEDVVPEEIIPRADAIYLKRVIQLQGTHQIRFDPTSDLVFHMHETLPQHPNGMRFCVFDKDGTLQATNEFFSIGGGFVVNKKTQTDHGENVYYKDRRVDNPDRHAGEDSQFAQSSAAAPSPHSTKTTPPTQPSPSPNSSSPSLAASASPGVPKVKVTASAKSPESTSSPPTATASIASARSFRTDQDLVRAALPFRNAEDLLDFCQTENLTIAQVVYKNELQWRSAELIRSGVLRIWKTMNNSIMNGMNSSDEYLPGSLKVRRRAPGLYRKLMGSLVETSGVNVNPGPPQARPQGPPGERLSRLNKNMASFQRSDVSMGQVSQQNLTVEDILPSPTAIRHQKRRLPALDWLSLYAIAVNEENAAGGKVACRTKQR